MSNYRKPEEGAISHVTPPCSGCGEPARIRGGIAVLMHKPDCRVDKDNAWYEAVADALHNLGKRWNDDTTPDEDAYILAYADTRAERPAHEMPCGLCSSAAGEEVVHGILECPRRDLN